MLVSGGEDGHLRMFSLASDFKSHKKLLEVKVTDKPISSVDISLDNSCALASG